MVTKVEHAPKYVIWPLICSYSGEEYVRQNRPPDPAPPFIILNNEYEKKLHKWLCVTFFMFIFSSLRVSSKKLRPNPEEPSSNLKKAWKVINHFGNVIKRLKRVRTKFWRALKNLQQFWENLKRVLNMYEKVFKSFDC